MDNLYTDDSRHLLGVLLAAREADKNPYPVTRDLFDLTPAKLVLLLDAMRLYVSGHSDHMSESERQDACELIAQLAVEVRRG